MALLRGPLQPAWALSRIYRNFFDKIPISDAWRHTLTDAAARGPIVHIVRNVSLLDLLALDAFSKKIALPPIAFANELGPWLGPSLKTPHERLHDAISRGASAVLFMKRHPRLLPPPGATHRGRSESDNLLRILVHQQRNTRDEIILIPETIVWTQRPERLDFSVMDTIFGSADFPGELRAAGQLLLNYKNCVLRAGEPLSLREFLAQEGQQDEATLTRRLTYALLRKLERERRAVLGPAQKPEDRVREEVLKSPKLQTILRELAGPDNEQRAILENRVRAMLRGLQAAPDPGTLKGLELAADTLATRVYAGIDIDQQGLESVREAARKGTVVLLPSHKSHVDYLLLSYVLRKSGLMAPLIAAGDNLSFFPLGPLFRRAGAFFIRRSFKGDRLYAAVVDAYIRRLMRDGYAIEFFLEGGRSRTGKLLPPKLGLLNMVVDAGLHAGGRPIYFVPVSIGYERMMEEGAYARELSGIAKRKENATALLKASSVLRNTYGRANLQIGQIIELGDIAAQMNNHPDKLTPAKRRALTTRIAHLMMSEINRVTAVTPGSLVALVLLCHTRRGMAHAALVDHCARLLRLVRRLGARTTPSLTRGPDGELRESSIRDAALLYVRGGLVRQHVPGDTLTDAAQKRARVYTGTDVIYTVPDEKRLMLDISKNIIIHLFIDRALISTALLTPHDTPDAPLPLSSLRERVQALSRLFKFEFMFRADAPFERIFDETIAAMRDDGELVLHQQNGQQSGGFRCGPGSAGLDGRGWISFYASVLQNFLEAYRIAARSLRVLEKGPLSEKELTERALRIGEQMFLGGEIDRSEAVSGPTIENAFAAFLEQGYLRRVEGKLELSESFASDEATQTIEENIASYLARRPSAASW